MMLFFLTYLIGFAAAGERLEGTRYLRAVAFDLLGRPPTMAEYELIEDGGDIPEALLTQWLESEEFADRIVKWHNGLLWNRISSTTAIQDSDFQLQKKNDVFWIRRRAEIYRGGADNTEHCGTEEATLIDGLPLPVVDANGIVREGYVWVDPFWDPGNPVKVCAYEAQELIVSPLGKGCSAKGAELDPACGCGPDLRWCFTSANYIGNTLALVQESIGEQVDQHVRRNILENRSYLELLQGDTYLLNGPLVHFYKHHLAAPNTLRTEFAPFDLSLLPNLDFLDKNTWIEVPGFEGSSGVFTMPGFLLRFMTNRARANRVNSAFLCSEFIGPQGGLPPDDATAINPDLTQRTGCDYCHARLEPMAAYWGRWAQNGTSYLDPDDFPAFEEFCMTCAVDDITCNETCDRYYITEGVGDAELEWLGWLEPYQFLQERYYDHVEQGPYRLVQKGLEDGSLQSCTVDTAVNKLMRRSLDNSEVDLKNDLIQAFVGSDYRYRELIRALVTSDAYRRMP